MSHDLLILIGQSQSSSDLQPTGLVTFSPIPVCCLKKELLVCNAMILANLAGAGRELASHNDRAALRATSLPLLSACYP